MSYVDKSASLMAYYQAKLRGNLDRVGVFLQGEIVRSFGSPMAMPKGTVTPVRGKRMKAKTFRSYQHSKPGEPPFRQSGTLARSIKYQIDERNYNVFVGSALQPSSSQHSYAWLLEMGSPLGQLAARPYLRPTIRNNKWRILRLLAGKN